MSKYLVNFSKKGYMQFISHLDLQRLFRRSIKRIGFHMEYSQGFNPHAKIAMAQPLSLGYEGLSEFLEVELKEDVEPEEFKTSINQIMPQGIEIINVDYFPENIKSLGANCCAAIYRIIFPKELYEKIRKLDFKPFLSQKEILVMKRAKKTKKLKEVNIKDKIRELSLDDERLSMIAYIDAGSESNLSPEQLLDAFMRFYKIDFRREDISVIREKMFFKDFAPSV